MSSTNRLRIRLTSDTYDTVMAEAERKETDPGSVIESYISTVRVARRGADRLYGSVLELKTLLNRVVVQARVKGVDLDEMNLPVAELAEKLNALHRFILEVNEVDLEGSPHPEPMTLERELRLEIEHERFLGQDDVG